MKNSKVTDFFYFLPGLLLLCFILSTASRCKDKPAGHKKFYVIMQGKYALGESGTVLLNGENIGTVSEGNSIEKEIEEGNYSIEIHTQKIKGVMKGSFVKSDQSIAFNANCDGAQATITANNDYAILDATYLVETVHFPSLQFTPGIPATATDVPPEQNAVFSFFDHKGKLRHSVTKTLYYGEKWNYSIPYQ